MKNCIIFVVTAIILISCGGGDFGTVGSKFDPEKYGITEGNSKSGYFADKDGKKGCVIEEKIAAPAIFDKIRGKDHDKDGKVLFIVEKDGKQGLYKAFEKEYMVPCEYEEVDVNAGANLLFLTKPGEEQEIFKLDTRQKVKTKEVSSWEEVEQIQKEKREKNKNK